MELEQAPQRRAIYKKVVSSSGSEKEGETGMEIVGLELGK